MSAADPAATPRASQSAAVTKSRLRLQVARARGVASDHAGANAARLPHLLAASAGHDTVACYVSVDAEPDTTALIEALHGRGVRVLLPILRGRRAPAWGWYRGPGSLRPGWRGIPEPDGEALGPDALAACSLVWVSALAVTPGGYRVGTGGGWYDRALPHARPDALRATLVGADEVVDVVPVDPWDLPVDVVVTPHRILFTGARAGFAPGAAE